MKQGNGFKSFTRFLREGYYRLASAASLLRDPLEIARLKQRKKAGAIGQVRCLVPFTRLEFLERGLVTSCCQAYTRVYTVGNIRRSTIEGIWNGRILQRMRRRMLLGEVEKTCHPHCPFLRQAPITIRDLPEDTERARRLKKDLEAAQTQLSAAPEHFTLANWGACNLRCVMCDSRSNTPLPPHVLKTQENLKHYFGQEVTLMLTGNGDPLARKDTRELLMNFPAAQYPGVQFEILTNGLLWTPQIWEKVKHCRFSKVNISVDAATRETYENIRQGGRWDTLMQAFELFRRAMEEQRVQRVLINMTVMRSNYRQVPAFLNLARRYGFFTSFAPIRGSFGDENIFDPQDPATLKELRDILHAQDLTMGDTNLAQFAAQVDHL